jgi:hypothetical protein
VRTPRGGAPHAPLGMVSLWGEAAGGAESRRRAWLRPVRPALPRVRAAAAAPEAPAGRAAAVGRSRLRQRGWSIVHAERPRHTCAAAVRGTSCQTSAPFPSAAAPPHRLCPLAYPPFPGGPPSTRARASSSSWSLLRALPCQDQRLLTCQEGSRWPKVSVGEVPNKVRRAIEGPPELLPPRRAALLPPASDTHRGRRCLRNPTTARLQEGAAGAHWLSAGASRLP